MNTSVLIVKKGRESPSESSKKARRDEARVEWRELLACESWLAETSTGKDQRPNSGSITGKETEPSLSPEANFKEGPIRT
jgi:hypothetical protein